VQRALRPPARPRSLLRSASAARSRRAMGPPRHRPAPWATWPLPPAAACTQRTQPPPWPTAAAPPRTRSSELGVRVCLVTDVCVLAAAVLALCHASAANLLAKRRAQSQASHVQVFSRGKAGGQRVRAAWPRGRDTTCLRRHTQCLWRGSRVCGQPAGSVGTAHRQHLRPARQAQPARWCTQWTSATRSITPACMATASCHQLARSHLPPRPPARPFSLLTMWC